MTTIETHAEAAQGSAVESFFGGVAAWSVTTDHKRIGRIYLGFGLLGLLAVSVLGRAARHRAGADSEVLDSGSLLQLFQAHRVGLVFAGVIPLTLGLSIAVVPLQLGARQIAFPRLALTGCYMLARRPGVDVRRARPQRRGRWRRRRPRSTCSSPATA